MNANVTVSADGLDVATIEAMFSDDAHYLVSYEDVGVGYARFSTDGSTDITANFTDLEGSAYNFTVEVDRTGDTTEPSIVVRENDPDVEFADSVVTEAAGDLADVTLDLEATDTTYLFIGSQETNVFERVEISDVNDDSQVTVRINTEAVGRNVSTVTGLDEVADAYTTYDDEIVGADRLRETHLW